MRFDIVPERFFLLRTLGQTGELRKLSDSPGADPLILTQRHSLMVWCSFLIWGRSPCLACSFNSIRRWRMIP